MSYIAGHNPAVLKGHSARTIQDSAAYLLPHLDPGHKILDIGCGPGSITLGFAERVTKGKVVGVDTSEELMNQNQQQAEERGIRNVRYLVGDIYRLPFEDGAFDVTHCHQVLCHLTDPRAAMKEMKRVTKPGGIVAAREAILETTVVYPSTPALDTWKSKLQEMHEAQRQHPNAGKQLQHWAIQVGFQPDNIKSSAGTFCYAGKEKREWWGSVWQARTVSKEWEKSMVETGIATKEELVAMAEAWGEWQTKEEAWFGMMHGEILAWV